MQQMLRLGAAVIRSSDSPAQAFVRVVILAMLNVVGGFVVLDDEGMTTTFTVGTVLAALALATVAGARGATVRLLNGVLAIALLLAAVAWPIALVVRAREIDWADRVMPAAITALVFVALWRVLSQSSAAGRWRRGGAAAVALAVMTLGAVGPMVEKVLAARASNHGSSAKTAADIAAGKVAASFDGLDLPTALIDQGFRIAAAMRALPPHAAGPETFVLAVGGNGFQAIFDREAHRAAEVLTARTPGPALVLSNTAEQVRHGLLAAPRTIDLAVAAIGHRAVPGDTLIVYLASHGSGDGTIAMDAPGLDFAALSSRRLAADLDHAGLTRRIVIVSACFGASWIPALASPTTIVIAAARADRTSFGCDDTRQLTVFGEAITGELAHRDLSLAQVFARAKARVAAVERAEGDTPSLPQAAVGAAMTGAWEGPR